MLTATPDTNTQTYAKFIDSLADMVVIEFIERGRTSLADSTASILEQGYTFLQRVYPAPWPKTQSAIDTLKRKGQMVLLDGLIRKGMPGVRNGVLELYEAMVQAADRRSLADQQEKISRPANTSTMLKSDVFLRIQHAAADVFLCAPASVTLGMNLLTDFRNDFLDVVELVMCLEDRFNIEINDNDANTIKTVRDAFNLICARLKQ